MEYIRLSDCAFYRNERTNKIDCDTYISTENMLPNRAGITVADALPDAINVSKYLPNDILLSNIRPYFKKIWFANREGGCSNDILVVAAKQNILASFLYYVLSDDTFFHYSSVTSKGTKMPRGTPNAIMKYPVPHPDEHDQQRIVSILSAYDNLIEVTVGFTDSKLGRIPNTFSIIKMQDAFDYYIGGGWGNDDIDEDFPVEAYVIRGTDFPHVSRGDVSSCPLRYHKKSNYDARELKADDVILEVSGGTAEQPVGRTLLVSDSILRRLGNKVICASFCKLIRLRKEVISPVYYYYWMQYLYNTRIIDRFQLQSTGIINFQFEYFLRKGEILLPPNDIINDFDAQVRFIHGEIAILAEQNEKLIQQRDLLLPRLMSGKLEV